MTIKQRPQEIELEGVSGTAARAMVATVHGMLPSIRFVFKTRTETLVIELPLEEAGKFIQQGITAIQAATPRIPRPAAHQLFD